MLVPVGRIVGPAAGADTLVMDLQVLAGAWTAVVKQLAAHWNCTAVQIVTSENNKKLLEILSIKTGRQTDMIKKQLHC